MKKLFIPATALFLAVSAVPVVAQDTRASSGDVAIKPSFEGLVAAMTNTENTVNELIKRQTIHESDIVVVDSKPLIEGQGDEMLKIQMDRYKGSIKQLHEVLDKHPAVKDRLKKESANPSVSEVIAAEILPGNKVQLYYKKM